MTSKIFDDYIAKDKSSLIPLLQDVQNIYGYLPENALQEISDFLEIPLSRTYGITVFCSLNSFQK